MTDKTFEIIKIGKHWVLRIYHTDPGYMPVCLQWVRIPSKLREKVITSMRDKGYCYQKRD